MAFNLSRATNLYLSTLGKDVFTGHNTNNTFEVRILDGYSFSQEAASETITLNEAGDAPVRGQKVFNTALNPAEVSFTTYIRPYTDTGDHTALERILWEALVGQGDAANLATAPFANTESDATSFRVDFENSDVHELLLLQAFFKLDNSTYQVQDVTINSAEVSFDIDGIAQVSWSAMGSDIIEDTSGRQNVTAWTGGVDFLASTDSAEFIKNKLSTMTLTDNAGTTAGTQSISYGSPLTGTDLSNYDGTNIYTATITVDGGTPQAISVDSSATGANPSIDTVIGLINDDLSGANLVLEDDGSILVTSISHGVGSAILVADDAATYKAFDFLTAAVTDVTINAATAGTGTGTEYIIPITGGSLSIENNITFLTPEELGKVNRPIGSFTGARSVSGSVTAYLRTGTTSSAQLLADLVAATTTVTHDFTLTLTAGGIANTPRAVFKLNHAHLVIPSINVEDVISTEIQFTGLGQGIESTDELNITYVAQ